MGGMPEHPWSHIAWARRYGVVRDDPLTPTRNPLAAAEDILGSRRFKALDEFSRDQATGSIRSQALSMVSDLLEPAKRERQWKARVREAASLGIHWDAKSERFAR